jgi:hypothetical protein
VNNKNLAFKLFAGAVIILAVITGRAISLTSTQNYMPIIYKALPITSTLTQTATSTSTATAASTSTTTPTSTSTSTSIAISTATATSTSTTTPTQPPATTGNIQITTIYYDGDGTTEPNEYVEIRNMDSFAIQLSSWTLRDIAEHIYTFPPFVMQPGQTCRVYTNEYHPEYCGFNYGYGSAIWNNTGDCAYLRNSASVLIDDYCY